MTPQTKFRMASHSKLFTATAIMQLRERGLLRLDDPVSKHLPWFAVTLAEPDDPPITIEELLTHSSGLPREAGSHWTTFEFPTTEQLRKLIAERHAPFSPEVRWKYSNLAYSIAGMVVEAVSGQTWADYVQQHIYQPLGMTARASTRTWPASRSATTGGCPTTRARPIRSSTPAAWRRPPASPPPSRTWRSSCRRSSGKGQRGGRQILSTGSLREMHRVRMLENNWTQGNAIGFAVRRERDKVYVSHGGSYPGYQTNTLLQLDGKVGVIVLTNADDGNPGGIATQLMNTVGEAVAKAAATPPAKTTWDPSWSRFAGLYRGRGGESHVVELNQRLVIINPNARQSRQSDSARADRQRAVPLRRRRMRAAVRSVRSSGSSRRTAASCA